MAVRCHVHFNLSPESDLVLLLRKLDRYWLRLICTDPYTLLHCMAQDLPGWVQTVTYFVYSCLLRPLPPWTILPNGSS